MAAKHSLWLEALCTEQGRDMADTMEKLYIAKMTESCYLVQHNRLGAAHVTSLTDESSEMARKQEEVWL